VCVFYQLSKPISTKQEQNIRIIPVGKIAEKAVCKNVFWHCKLSAELTKNALIQKFFGDFAVTGMTTHPSIHTRIVASLGGIAKAKQIYKKKITSKNLKILFHLRGHILTQKVSLERRGILAILPTGIGVQISKK